MVGLTSQALIYHRSPMILGQLEKSIDSSQGRVTFEPPKKSGYIPPISPDEAMQGRMQGRVSLQ